MLEIIAIALLLWFLTPVTFPAIVLAAATPLTFWPTFLVIWAGYIIVKHIARISRSNA